MIVLLKGELILIDHDARDPRMKHTISGLLNLSVTQSERALYPENIKKMLKDNGFKIRKTSLLRLNGDQQALKPSIISRIIKVPILLFLSLFENKYQGDFLIIAKSEKSRRRK